MEKKSTHKSDNTPKYKTGALKTGSGKTVTSREQAMAIGLNEARKAGANIPKKKNSAK